MNTKFDNLIPLLLVFGLCTYGMVNYFIESSRSDGGMLFRARAAIVEAGNKEFCDDNGKRADTGLECWTSGAFRLTRDKENHITLFRVDGEETRKIAGTRRNDRGQPEVFADRPHLEEAITELESSRA